MAYNKTFTILRSSCIFELLELIEGVFIHRMIQAYQTAGRRAELISIMGISISQSQERDYLKEFDQGSPYQGRVYIVLQIHSLFYQNPTGGKTLRCQATLEISRKKGRGVPACFTRILTGNQSQLCANLKVSRICAIYVLFP